MPLAELKVGIIGGSIAGCAAAVALMRGGFDVHVFERSSRGLKDRGSGIAIPGPLRDQLIGRGYLPADYPNCPVSRRWWQFQDGSSHGRRLWVQLTPMATNNWGNLWRSLRRLVPDEVYSEGKELAGFEELADGVTARFSDGSRREFDLLIGADGYNSLVRHSLHPEADPDYADYVLWRGNYPERELADRALLDAGDREGAWFTVPYPGGHGVLYMIPDFDGGTTPGARRVNWAVYSRCPKALKLDRIESIPPGSVTPDVYAEFEQLLARHFPPAIGDLIRHSSRDDVSIQPIYDSVVDTYVGPRTLLIGDAGTITRPHTASGATKALEDAMALEEIAQTASDLPELLARYDKARCEAARTVSGIGKRIGRAQVLETPDWGNMRPSDFEAWSKAIFSGDTLYLWGETA